MHQGCRQGSKGLSWEMQVWGTLGLGQAGLG